MLKPCLFYKKSSVIRAKKRLFLYGDFIHALLVAATFEAGGEELVHNLASHVIVDETAWHYQYVGIVVLTDEMCNLGNPAQSGAHLLVLVQGD